MTATITVFLPLTLDLTFTLNLTFMCRDCMLLWLCVWVCDCVDVHFVQILYGPVVVGGITFRWYGGSIPPWAAHLYARSVYLGGHL